MYRQLFVPEFTASPDYIKLYLLSQGVQPQMSTAGAFTVHLGVLSKKEMTGDKCVDCKLIQAMPTNQDLGNSQGFLLKFLMSTPVFFICESSQLQCPLLTNAQLMPKWLELLTPNPEHSKTPALPTTQPRAPLTTPSPSPSTHHTEPRAQWK